MRRIALRLAWVSLALASLVAAISFAACGDDDYGDSAAQPTAVGALPPGLTTVTVSDNKFAPVGLQVPVGTRVTWTWTGRNPHQVVGTFADASVESPKLTGSGLFQFEFKTAGTFAYECGVHGAAMAGTVTVQ